MNINELFKIGMKRYIPSLQKSIGKQINLGAGKSPIATAISLDLPAWDAEWMSIPFDDAEIGTIWALHFLEHFDGVNVIKILHECERVLQIGGVMNVVVPFYNTQMAHQDLDHKSFWSEKSWEILFHNLHYIKNREVPWQFEIGTNIIIGIAENNLCLMTQLIKGCKR